MSINRLDHRTRTLVTGGARGIGRAAVVLLLDEGHSVTVFDNLELGHRAAIDTRAALMVGDLRDADAIDRAIAETRPDAVMHFAADALVGESMAHPERYFGNNVTGGLNLAAAMLRHGVRRIVLSSTCATYGEPERLPITEDSAQRPTNPYGESKLMLERALDWYRRLHGLHVQTAIGIREQLKVFGDDYPTPDGTPIRDYIHVSDLARAHLLALTTPASGALRRPGDPPVLVAAADKAQQVLGWTPQIPAIEDIIASAWDWHRAHPDGYGE